MSKVLHSSVTPRQETARVNGELGERYIRVLDPYAMPRQ